MKKVAFFNLVTEENQINVGYYSYVYCGLNLEG